MVTVVNKHKHKPTPNDFYIGRGSVLGNQFTGSKQLIDTKARFQVGSRAEAIMLYSLWLNEKLDSNSKEVCDEMNKIYKLAKKGTVNLVCYCKPQACHGDVIKEVIDQVIYERFTVINCDRDIRHNYKKYAHEARSSNKPILLISDGEHQIYEDVERAENHIHSEYRYQFNKSLQEYTNYGDPEVTGFPF